MRNIATILWRELVIFRSVDHDVRIVLDQHAKVNFESAVLLQHQLADRHIVPLEHHILIWNQSVFIFAVLCFSHAERTKTSNINLLTWQGANSPSITFAVRTLIIIPPMDLSIKQRKICLKPETNQNTQAYYLGPLVLLLPKL